MSSRRALGWVSVVMLALRIAYVLAVPDFDGDAYGHFHIAGELIANPTNLALHWVWLPGWHFFVSTLVKLGLAFRDVRLLHAVLATAGPFLLREIVRASGDAAADRAALAYCLCALPNLLGTSALMETTFVLVVLALALTLERRAAWGAAACLVLACTLRYEAWVLAAALGLQLVVSTWRRRAIDRELLVVVLPAATMVAIYIVSRRMHDGSWLWFARESAQFGHGVRVYLVRSPWFDAVWPVLLVLLLLGPAALLIPIAGIRWTRSSVLPLALLVFFLLTYFGKSVLGQPRYLAALMPFACFAIARATTKRDRLWPWALASLVTMTGVTGVRTSRSVLAVRSEWTDKEHWANGG